MLRIEGREEGQDGVGVASTLQQVVGHVGLHGSFSFQHRGSGQALGEREEEDSKIVRK